MKRACFGVIFGLMVACNTNVVVDPAGYACDAQNPCASGYHCEQSVCVIGNPSCLCGAPPAAECKGAVSRVYVGRCVGLACQFDARDTVCAKGCNAGVCNTQACSAQACTMPPPATCVSASTLRTYATQGACTTTGACSYSSTDSTCPGGCSNGQCKGSCDSASCTMPPAAACADASTLRTYSTPGSCGSNGACQYTARDTACPNGCLNGQCQADPCAAITCDQAPAPSCVDANTLRTWQAPGSCAQGQCSYVSKDTVCTAGCENNACKNQDLCMGVQCTTPPAPECVGTVARQYKSPGTCERSTGTCTYQASDTTCTSSCTLGQCVNPSLTFTQVAPLVRFAINGLDVSADGSTALAVGNAGHVAQWTGSEWRVLATPASSPDLKKVSFVSPSVAYLVGTSRTVWKWSGGTVTAVPLSNGSGSTTLVSVHGRGEDNVLVAGPAGEYWHYNGSAWSSGPLSSANAPYAMSSTFVDESGDYRIAGRCTSTSNAAAGCVAYHSLSWYQDLDAASQSFTAMGGGFTASTATASTVLVGRADGSMSSHDEAGTFTPLAVTLGGAGVVGISAEAGTSRSVYALTSSLNSVGHLYQLDSTLGSVSARSVLDTFLGEETLSPTVASTGVLLAEVNRKANANNVFRHSKTADEAYDLGIDFIGTSVDPLGNVVVANAHGDLAIRRRTTWEFHRATGLTIRALEARQGGSVLLAGRENAGDGVIMRYGLTGYTKVATRAGVVFNGLCRVSDLEGWAVGTSGTLYSVTGIGAAVTSSGTSKDLLSVDCAAGSAVACGADGAVLRYSAGSWAPISVPPEFAGHSLTQCRLFGSTIVVAGESFMAMHANGTWAMLPGKASLQGLAGPSPNELYATATITPATTGSVGTSGVYRFDGARWSSSLIEVSGQLSSGFQASGHVVFAGTGGVLVDGH